MTNTRRISFSPAPDVPTLLTHPAVPLAIGWSLGRHTISSRLLFAGVVAAVLPDLDVLAFRLGIPYAAEFGHRGFSHSLVFASLVAILGTAAGPVLHATRRSALAFLFVAAASHGILDTLTNGGLGIALLWPFSTERFFAPFHPIEVAPLAVRRLLSPKGWHVLRSEILWVWLPLFVTAALSVAYRQRSFGRRFG